MFETKQNPGLDELPCSRTTAHGPHVNTEWPDQADYWCEGVRVHPNTMIGQP